MVPHASILIALYSDVSLRTKFVHSNLLVMSPGMPEYCEVPEQLNTPTIGPTAQYLLLEWYNRP